MGDARRLPNVNVLISWSTLRYLSEVTRAGEEVWRLEMPVGDALPGRVVPLEDLYAGWP